MLIGSTPWQTVEQAATGRQVPSQEVLEALEQLERDSKSNTKEGKW